MRDRKPDNKITDLTSGIYRRQYAGYIRGKRINSISLNAEAWFWRFHSAADDFGNGPADPLIAYHETVGRRENVSANDVSGWLKESIGVDLMRTYVVAEESYFHIVDFIRKQPAGKNGKRVRHYPASPWDLCSEVSETGESGCIQIDPEKLKASLASDSDSHSDTDSELPPSPRKRGKGCKDGPPGFLLFWAAWPALERKTGRAACLRIWRRQNLETQTTAILAGLERWKLSRAWAEGFDPMPSTWLNDSRWEAENIEPACADADTDGALGLSPAREPTLEEINGGDNG